MHLAGGKSLSDESMWRRLQWECFHVSSRIISCMSKAAQLVACPHEHAPMRTESMSCGWHRGMRGDAARKVCPELQLVQVPTAHGKAALTLYRDSGKQVAHSPLHASSDSAGRQYAQALQTTSMSKLSLSR